MPKVALADLKMKTREEVLAELREMIRRHRRRYIRKYLRPCPTNCSKATVEKGRAVSCGRCGSWNPEQCRTPELYMPITNKDDLYEEFEDGLRDPEVLRHEYRDLLVLMWVLGVFDGERVETSAIDTLESSKDAPTR